MVLRKDQLEVQLREEHQQIRDGLLKEDSPLDVSPQFQSFLHACRVGDLKGCQEAIAAGTNINARDTFDYTPLILVSAARSLAFGLPTNNPRQAFVGIMKWYSSSLNQELSANETPSKANDACTTPLIIA